MTITPRYAMNAFPGTELPPAATRFAGIPHVVKERQIGHHGQVTLVTNMGTWQFHPYELVEFPRRPDGSRVNWVLRGEQPRPDELAVGDVLPPNLPTNETLREMYANEMGQVVRDVKAHVNDAYVYVITMDHSSGTTRRWVMHANLPIVFPRPEKFIQPRRVRPTVDELKWRREWRLSGTYVHLETQQRYRFFVRRPLRTKGRWPAGIPGFAEATAKARVEPKDLITCRPPSFLEWPLVDLVEGLPHPSDRTNLDAPGLTEDDFWTPDE